MKTSDLFQEIKDSNFQAAGYLFKFLKLSLLFFVVTLPLQNRDLFSFFGTRLFPPRLILIEIILLMAVLGLFLVIKSGDVQGSVRHFLAYLWRDYLFRILFLLWVVRVISLAETLNLKASLSLMLFYTSMIALYVILRFVREKDHKFLGKIFNFYIFTVALVGAFGFIQALLSPFGFRFPGVLVGSTFIRIPATFYDANHLPPYLLTGLPYIFVLSLRETRPWLKYILYILTGILSLVVFLTFSRSGVISFSVVFLFFVSYFIKMRYWRKLSFLAGICAVIVLLIFISSKTNLSFVKRAASIFDLQDKSTVAHGILLYGGFEIWQRNPIFGVGYGGFSEAFRATQLGKEHAYFDPATQVRLPIHSIWLETLAETGIIGFSIYLSLMIIVAEKFWKVIKIAKNQKTRLAVLALLSSLIAILTGGIFYSYNLEFFWFFIFFAYLFCDVLLKEGRAEAEKVVPEPHEIINWSELAPLILVIAVAFPLLIYNLSYPLVSSGQEGFFAVISKTIRRTGGMGWPFWWIPKFEDVNFFSKPPLLFWLNAFSIFLYDITTAAIRFWSAFFSFLSVVLLYLSVRILYNRRRAAVAALLLLAMPGFAIISRQGIFEPLVLFSFVSLVLTYILARRKSVYFCLFASSFAISTILDQQASSVLGLIFLAAIIFDIFAMKNSKIYKSFWILAVPLLTLLINLPWVLVTYKTFGKTFLSGYFSLQPRSFLEIILLAALPLLSILLSKSIYRVRLFFIVGLLTFFTFGQILLVPQNNNWKIIGLINKRLEVDRRGTIPLVIATERSTDLLYYSEVPIIFAKESELRGYFTQERAYFFIVDGNQFSREASDLTKNNVSTRVITANSNLVLVEKFGVVP